MEDGARYVVNSQNTLYHLTNSSCDEGDTVVLQNTVVERVYLVNGKWQAADIYTTSNYNPSSYICHIWDNNSQYFNVNYLILPAVLIMLCLFFVINKWFMRLRG